MYKKIFNDNYFGIAFQIVYGKQGGLVVISGHNAFGKIMVGYTLHLCVN